MLISKPVNVICFKNRESEREGGGGGGINSLTSDSLNHLFSSYLKNRLSSGLGNKHD